MNSTSHSPCAVGATDDQRNLRQLEARLTAETAERKRLGRELDIRNCAFDAAATHFIIGDTTKPNWPVHGGSIDVQSTIGVGAHFIVRLPVAGRAVTSHSANSSQAP